MTKKQKSKSALVGKLSNKSMEQDCGIMVRKCISVYATQEVFYLKAHGI
jgi:TfoX/Sxy family transcriptional regulator of competence genes